MAEPSLIHGQKGSRRKSSLAFPFQPETQRGGFVGFVEDSGTGALFLELFSSLLAVNEEDPIRWAHKYLRQKAPAQKMKLQSIVDTLQHDILLVASDIDEVKARIRRRKVKKRCLPPRPKPPNEPLLEDSDAGDWAEMDGIDERWRMKPHPFLRPILSPERRKKGKASGVRKRRSKEVKGQAISTKGSKTGDASTKKSKTAEGTKKTSKGGEAPTKASKSGEASTKKSRTKGVSTKSSRTGRKRSEPPPPEEESKEEPEVEEVKLPEAATQTSPQVSALSLDRAEEEEEEEEEQEDRGPPQQKERPRSGTKYKIYDPTFFERHIPIDFWTQDFSVDQADDSSDEEDEEPPRQFTGKNYKFKILDEASWLPERDVVALRPFREPWNEEHLTSASTANFNSIPAPTLPKPSTAPQKASAGSKRSPAVQRFPPLFPSTKQLAASKKLAAQRAAAAQKPSWPAPKPASPAQKPKTDELTKYEWVRKPGGDGPTYLRESKHKGFPR